MPDEEDSRASWKDGVYDANVEVEVAGACIAVGILAVVVIGPAGAMGWKVSVDGAVGIG